MHPTTMPHKRYVRVEKSAMKQCTPNTDHNHTSVLHVERGDKLFPRAHVEAEQTESDKGNVGHRVPEPSRGSV